MTSGDKIMRAIAFYLAVVLFLVTLPILLSYSLGYHIDINALSAYKTGIIYINSNPQGASVYINGKPDPNPTPTQIEDLKPGTYKIQVKLEGFYTWEQELVVRPNMVTKADRIILFPTALEMKKIIEHQAYEFAISKSYIYYMMKQGLFRSNIDGTSFKLLAPYSNWPDNIKAKKFSPDGRKLLYFTYWDIYVIYLNQDKTTAQDEDVRIQEVLKTQSSIVDVFWYSTSNYLIVVTEEDVKVMELRDSKGRNIVSLYKFNKKPAGLYYDDTGDSIYFTDTGKDRGAQEASYLYRIDLRRKFLDYLKGLLIKREAGLPNE